MIIAGVIFHIYRYKRCSFCPNVAQLIRILQTGIMVSLRYILLFLCISLSTVVMAKVPSIKLSSGYEMPVVGLGTWQLAPNDADKAITAALESGYRHIDTAFIYANEEAIGKSLKKWFDKGGKREDLFITTKLSPISNRASDVEKYMKLSLERLNLQYVDMFLIHVPMSFVKDPNKEAPAMNEDGSIVLDKTNDLVATWKEMEKQVKAGRTRSIGLSNFNESQIQRIVDSAEIQPSNLQVELHAYMQQKPLRELCKKHNIAVTAYSTLGSPGASPDKKTDASKALPQLLKNPQVVKIAEAHKKTPAQILLRHAVQSGVIVIPKSTNAARIKANIDLFDFELSDQEMKTMEGLDRGESGRIFNFLVFKGVENHPEYPYTSQIPKKSS
ncbi:1,5-anhydro-D-fructose reductase-like [Trichogramma pretiosum]|uniref:1,5-anhydro-D-fructose reductase-like n=1 Tax=Trichogramma pretiosum TaxID=7493 RepID=UPI0006C98AA0|nr:1,5-anhydro-D-fructose reductase-like [Trichogramma pretiosum]